MKSTIKKAIDDYNVIFKNGGVDTKLECNGMKQYSLNCMALDGIEICSYIIMKRTDCEDANLVDIQQIQWKILEIDYEGKKENIFYPSIDFQEEIQELKLRKCSKNNYVSTKVCDFESYKTCTMQSGEKSVISTDIEIEMLFDINRRGKRLEELKFLSMFLCCDIEIMHCFYKSMLDYVKKHQTEDLKQLKEDINNFVAGVRAINDNLKKENYEDFSKLMETSRIVAELMRKRRYDDGNVMLSDEFQNRFFEKLEKYVRFSKRWSKRKKINGKSCKDYEREIESMAK